MTKIFDNVDTEITIPEEWAGLSLEALNEEISDASVRLQDHNQALLRTADTLGFVSEHIFDSQDIDFNLANEALTTGIPDQHMVVGDPDKCNIALENQRLAGIKNIHKAIGQSIVKAVSVARMQLTFFDSSAKKLRELKDLVKDSESDKISVTMGGSDKKYMFGDDKLPSSGSEYVKEFEKFTTMQKVLIDETGKFVKKDFMFPLKAVLATITIVYYQKLFKNHWKRLNDYVKKVNTATNAKTVNTGTYGTTRESEVYLGLNQVETVYPNGDAKEVLDNKKWNLLVHDVRQYRLPFESSKRPDQVTVTITKAEMLKLIDLAVSLAESNKKYNSIISKMSHGGAFNVISTAITAGLNTLITGALFANYRLFIITSKIIAGVTGNVYTSTKVQTNSIISLAKRFK